MLHVFPKRDWIDLLITSACADPELNQPPPSCLHHHLTTIIIDGYTWTSAYEEAPNGVNDDTRSYAFLVFLRLRARQKDYAQ